VIDDRIAWIGSFNLDPRSVHLNTEVGLVIWDERVARAIKDDILRDMAPQNSWTIGKAKDVPVISTFSDLIGNILQVVPIVDVWPFQYTSSFALNEGKQLVPFYDERFYDHYTSVGSFPEVGLSIREVEIRLLKAFTGVAMPII
jgi:phosphatidylserine/phosphatidylglycerophosphate/cardiolipin synthase-like enzyme